MTLKLEVLHIPAEGSPKPNPLLLVHGAWHGAWCWQETFMPYFAGQGYHTYALSLRGHAGSPNDRPLRLTGARHYVQDVAQVAAQIAAEHPAPVLLIGHSMGGYVVQKYLEQHPAAGAVLLASIPVTGVAPFLLLRVPAQQPGTLPGLLLQMRGYPVVATPQRAKHWFYSDSVPLEQVQQIHPKLGDEAFLVVLDSLLLALPRPRRILARGVPLLVLGAQQDRIFRPWEQRRTARAYGTEAVIFPNMAHNMMHEQGWESVAERIAGWFAEIEHKF